MTGKNWTACWAKPSARPSAPTGNGALIIAGRSGSDGLPARSLIFSEGRRWSIFTEIPNHWSQKIGRWPIG